MPRNFSKFFRSSVWYSHLAFLSFANRSQVLKEVSETITISMGPKTSMRPVVDGAGNLKGFEKVRRIENQSTGEYEIQKVETQQATDDDDDEEDDGLECEGMTEDDIQAEKQYQEEQKQEREQVMLKNWKKFTEETDSLNKQIREAKAEGSNTTKDESATPFTTAKTVSLSRPHVGPEN
jgi:hypothetical protein